MKFPLAMALVVAILTLIAIGKLMLKTNTHEGSEKYLYNGISMSRNTNGHQTDKLCLIQRKAEETMLIYNMVPKCGSRGFREIIKGMVTKNNFTAMERKYNNPPNVISPYHLSETGVQTIIKNQFHQKKQPWLFYGHLHFINFTEAGYPMTPSYINIVRDPIERLLSFYYFRRENNMRYSGPLRFLINRFGEAGQKRKEMNFNDCVLTKDIECSDTRFMFGVIPHFCGQDPMCVMPSESALAKAKQNALTAFKAIGYLENYEQFIEVVEYMFPQYFDGALKLYHNISDRPIVRHKSTTKVKVTSLTKDILMQRKDIQHEYDFYKFVKQMFDHRYKTLTRCRTELNP